MYFSMELQLNNLHKGQQPVPGLLVWVPKWTYHELDERQRLVAQVTIMSQPITTEYWREYGADEEEEGDLSDHDDNESDDESLCSTCS